MAASCLLAVLLAVTTAQSQHASQYHQQQQQQLEQYDPNTSPQLSTGEGAATGPGGGGEHISGRRFKRMYAMCPPGFFRIGNECYYISHNRQNWLDAHFECKDRNSKLAEPMKFDDKNLRKFLQKSKEKNYIWIGGNYNWRANKWQWGYNGKDIGYQSFSQMVPGSSQDLKFHCAVLNPDLKFRWSAKLCTEKLNFICQHKMPLVNSHSRAKVYTRWNETFPNELANEVEVVVADQPRSSNVRDYYSTAGGSKLNLTKLNRTWKKLNRTQRIRSFRNRNRSQQQRNEYISNDIIHRPVVEYASDHSYNSINGNGNGNGNGYRNGNGAFNRGFNVDIHRQKPHKDRRLNDVNGEYRHHRHRPATKTPATTTTEMATTTTTTTTPVPETLPTEALQVATERYQPPQLSQAERKNRRDQLRDRLARLSPQEREQFYAKRATTTTTERYQQQLSHDEKKARRDKLRERLAQLTPEERDMFFAERAKRKQSKKQRSKNETIP